MSLANETIMPVIPAPSTYNNGNSGWDDGAWWIVLFLIFAFAGWGGAGGWNGSGNGGQGGYDTRADLQRGFDNQSVINKLNGLENGISASVYDLNNTLNSNFRSLDNAICQLGYQTQAGFNQTNVTALQGQAALQQQISNCCCENREAIQGVNYSISQQTNALQNALNCSTRDILENQNANARAILDQMCNDKIQALRDENSTLKLAASQQAQNNVLMGAMQNQTNEVLARTAPIPVPAYQVPAPYNVVPPVGGVPCLGGVV